MKVRLELIVPQAKKSCLKKKMIKKAEWVLVLFSSGLFGDRNNECEMLSKLPYICVFVCNESNEQAAWTMKAEV